MAKKSAIRVALDLETTGLHADQDAILEVAAIKFQGQEVLDTFETFVSPGRPIPYRVQRLTGIRPELLVGAPHFEAITRKLQAFLGEYPIVGHSIPFDAGFLRRWGLARLNPLVDTFELATVMLPSLSSYNLGQVAESLGIHVPLDRHRAMVDTVLAMQVFLALHTRLQAIDISLLKDLANLDAPRTWPLLHFFRQELRDRQERDGVQGSLVRGSLGDRFAAQLGMDPRVLTFAIARQQNTTTTLPEDPEEETTPASSAHDPAIQPALDPETLSAIIQATGYHNAKTAIHESLENKTSLLLETTTGGSDYIPALLPALEWLQEQVHQQQSHKLVIACASQQSARRLIEDILPRLQAHLKSNLPVAYLAEKGGYLCTHRWFGAAWRRTSGELTAEQARGLAKLALWAQQTQTGERSELTLLPQEMAAWERISSGIEHMPSADKRAGTMYERCTYRRKGLCFVSRAEERVKAASIIVTTHAALLDDLSQPRSLLHNCERRLILDADLLEEESARWSTFQLDQQQLLQQLNTVGIELADGRYQGLLALAAPVLRENGPGGLSTKPTITKAELDSRLLNWFQILRQARTSVEKLFGSLTVLVEEHAQGGNSSGREKGGRGHGGRNHERLDQPLRLTPGIRQLSSWANVEKAWQQTSNRLQNVIDMLHEAEKVILASQHNRRRQDTGSSEESSVASELAAAAWHVQEARQLGKKALSSSDNDTVYWLRMQSPPIQTGHIQSPQRGPDSALTLSQPAEPSPLLYAQVVQTTDVLRRLLHYDTTSTIFVGAALSVDNSFAFARGRLGLENEMYPAASIVNEHHEQTLLYLPDDVPEPNAPQYQRHLDESLIHLATALEGNLAVLYTSHAALRSSYATIKPLLETRNILVLGQGVDGSPRQLWQIFQRQERVVLLGTGNFWEGGEDGQRSPSCLVITRLPMPVLNDPPVAARAEQYSDQLHQLTVPIAALRIRRALNRIVWSEQKRNTVVLFDRRVTSKEYGAMILHSLPHCSQRQGPASRMPEHIIDWLTGTGAWEE